MDKSWWFNRKAIHRIQKIQDHKYISRHLCDWCRKHRQHGGVIVALKPELRWSI
jgi:hypothetical protein